MVYTVLIKEEAQQDTLAAYLYYEEQLPGLGDRFLKELNVRYKQLEKNPQHYSFITADIEKTMRSVKIKDFPFVIIYDCLFTEVIVYAVHNYNMRPRQF